MSEGMARETWLAAVRLGERLGRIPADAAARGVDLLRPEGALPSITALADACGVPAAVLDGLRVLAAEIPDAETQEAARATALARLARLEAAARAALQPASDAITARIGERTDDSSAVRTQRIGTAQGVDALLAADAPRQLGPYQLLEILGRGGMGAVFRARHEKLGTFCAVKVMLAGEFASGEAVGRFRREAAAVAKMGKHPHIVTVHDLGEENGRSYYAMDLVEGKSLRARLAEKEYGTKEAVALLEKVARALHFAHRSGVIHRDLKPDNVMIGTDGEPQVMDFGLARDVSSADRLSVSGEIMGTLTYMAPEQARGEVEKTDARTDVYALGGILYELLTGVPPHPGKTVAQVMPRILAGDIIPPRRFRPNLPVDLETVCLKALAFEPDRRYATADLLADDLARWRRGEPISARPVGALTRLWMRARRNKAVAVPTALLVVVVAGGLIAWAASAIHRRVERGRRVGEAEAALARKDAAAALAAATAAQRIAPDDPDVKDLVGRARAEESVARGEVAFAAYRQAAKEAADLHGRRRALEREAESLRSFADRVQLWEAAAAARNADLRRESRFAEAVAAFTEALGFWNGHPTARARLGDLQWDRYLDAERERDSAAMASARALLEGIGGVSRDAEVLGARDVRIAFRLPASCAASATIHAFLHVYRRRDAPPVLAPVPCAPRTGAPGSPPQLGPAEPVPFSELGIAANAEVAIAARRSSAYVLAESDANRADLPVRVDSDGRASAAFAARLPIGSYLLHVPRGQGTCELRYPFTVTRDAGWNESCEVPSEEDLPPLPPGGEGGEPHDYWRFVPQGPYLAGGDPEAPTAMPRDASIVRVDHGYFVGRFEITTGMYLRYMEDRGWQSREQAYRRLPRTSVEPSPDALLWTWDDAGEIAIRAKSPEWRSDWTIYFVTCNDLLDYARWLTERAGAGRWEFAPPGEDEWEKAARGVDGRWYPWGDEFDPVFARVRGSRTEPQANWYPEPAGMFPLDESPFGVRDMGGMMYEWTSTTWAGDDTARISKGTGWSGPSALARCAFRGLGGVAPIIPDISARLRARRRP